MPSRSRSSHTCTCAQSLRSVDAVACVAARLELVRMSIQWTKDDRPERVVSFNVRNYASDSQRRSGANAPYASQDALNGIVALKYASHKVEFAEKHLQSVVFVPATPLRALEDPKRLDDHSACQAERTGQPTQDAARTSAFAGVLGNAAYRDEGYRASTAADEGRLGSSGRRSMDL